jgi:hypothetical protein
MKSHVVENTEHLANRGLLRSIAMKVTSVFTARPSVNVELRSVAAPRAVSVDPGRIPGGAAGFVERASRLAEAGEIDPQDAAELQRLVTPAE